MMSMGITFRQQSGVRYRILVLSSTLIAGLSVHQFLWLLHPPVLTRLHKNIRCPNPVPLREFLRPVSGPYDLVTMEGELWKTWRGIFNPGFSAGHLMTLVPGIIKDISTFCEILREHASDDDVFLLDEVTVKMTMDVIGRITL